MSAVNLRTMVLSGFGCVLATSAFANPRGEHPMQLEVGINTRQFEAAEGEQVAFRTMTPGAVDPAQDESSALTMSLRFTGKARFGTFFGVEGEVGEIVGLEGSNVAGAYGIAGARAELGRLRMGVEVAAGRRWIRYDLDGREDLTLLMAEPRVRADLWMSPRFTIGGAAGATIGDRAVWMAGFYIGIHSQDFDARR